MNKLVLILSLVILPLFSFADEGNHQGGGNNGSGGGNGATVPIDGGASILALAGVIYIVVRTTRMKKTRCL